jgi:hypothetical protein
MSNLRGTYVYRIGLLVRSLGGLESMVQKREKSGDQKLFGNIKTRAQNYKRWKK